MKKSENDDWRWIHYSGFFTVMYSGRSHRNLNLAAQLLLNLIGIVHYNADVFPETVVLDTYDLDFQHVPDVVL